MGSVRKIMFRVRRNGRKHPVEGPLLSVKSRARNIYSFSGPSCRGFTQAPSRSVHPHQPHTHAALAIIVIVVSDYLPWHLSHLLPGFSTHPDAHTKTEVRPGYRWRPVRCRGSRAQGPAVSSTGWPPPGVCTCSTTARARDGSHVTITVTAGTIAPSGDE
jgi:hypothetical protein